MTLMAKTPPDEICQHLKRVLLAIKENDITMSHDFEGTYLYCSSCDSSVVLEAYGEGFSDEDIGEITKP